MMLRIGNKQQGTEKKQNTELHTLNPEPCPLSPEKGLTLVEVMLAVSILTVGIGGVLRAYAGSVAVLEAGQYSIDAVNLLKQKMAEVEQMILEQEEISQGSERGEFEDALEDFLWEWEINPAGTEDLHELTLTVSHKYNPRTFSLKTYVVDKKKEEE